MKIIETFKAHPYLAAGGVFVLGVILVIAFSGGSGGQAGAPVYMGTDNSSSVEANTAITMAQLQAQAATNIAGQSAMVENNRTAAQIELGKIQRDVALANTSAARDTTMAQIEAQKGTQELISTLSAQTSQSQINAQVTIAQTAAQMQTTMATIQAKQATDLATMYASMLQTQQQYAYLQHKTDSALEAKRLAANSNDLLNMIYHAQHQIAQ